MRKESLNIIKLCDVKQPSFFGWQTSPIIFSVQAFIALELFHFITTLKLPPFQSQTSSGRSTADRDIRALRGDSSSRFQFFLWGGGGDLCLYKLQVQRGLFFF